jgi:hypothetical protein
MLYYILLVDLINVENGLGDSLLLDSKVNVVLTISYLP